TQTGPPDSTSQTGPPPRISPSTARTPSSLVLRGVATGCPKTGRKITAPLGCCDLIIGKSLFLRSGAYELQHVLIGCEIHLSPRDHSGIMGTWENLVFHGQHYVACCAHAFLEVLHLRSGKGNRYIAI